MINLSTDGVKNWGGELGSDFENFCFINRMGSRFVLAMESGMSLAYEHPLLIKPAPLEPKKLLKFSKSDPIGLSFPWEKNIILPNE
jgi:hypothetical protein